MASSEIVHAKKCEAFLAFPKCYKQFRDFAFQAIAR